VRRRSHLPRSLVLRGGLRSGGPGLYMLWVAACGWLPALYMLWRLLLGLILTTRRRGLGMAVVGWGEVGWGEVGLGIAKHGPLGSLN
jgi:hypothetical protein